MNRKSTKGLVIGTMAAAILVAYATDDTEPGPSGSAGWNPAPGLDPRGAYPPRQ